MDKQFNQLTTDEITRLVILLFEQHGSELNRDCFTEYLLDILEEIAGLESVPDNLDELIDAAYQKYQQLT